MGGYVNLLDMGSNFYVMVARIYGICLWCLDLYWDCNGVVSGFYICILG